MDTNVTQPGKEMDPKVTPLTALHPDLDDIKIDVRCISVWKSHPMGRPKEVWSFDIMFQDLQGTRIQAVCKNDNINKFQLLLDEGACYRIGNFGLGNNGGSYPLVNHQFKLEFFKNTSVTRLASFDNNHRGFKFEHLSAFTARTFKESELCDVIGTVVSVSDAIPFNYFGENKLRRTIILEDVEGVKLECCFFDEWCHKFANLYNERETLGHVVIILQLGKVKYFNRKPSYSNAMYSTKVYINDDIPEIAAFRKRYAERAGFDPKSQTIEAFTPIKKELTADDFFDGGIKKMVANIRDSIAQYHCVIYAKIFKIHREYGWTYLACKKCGRSAKEAQTDEQNARPHKLWECKMHKNLTVSAVGMRYKLIVRVVDDTGSASLLLFEDMVVKLSGEQCADLIKKHGENYDDYFPVELNVLIGKTMLFRFHYTDDHIKKNNYVYQVKLMSDDASMIARFKNNFILQDAESLIETPIPTNDKSSKFNTGKNIPFLLEDNPKTPVVLTKENGSKGSIEDDTNVIASGDGQPGSSGSSGSEKRTIIDLDDYDEDAARAKKGKPTIQVKSEPEE